jgi:hypothetical protein
MRKKKKKKKIMNELRLFTTRITGVLVALGVKTTGA